jgi:cysteine desulfurase
MSREIYLDYNASTPICPEAVEAMRPFLADHYGNPSSLHWAGMPAKDAVEKARGQVASLFSLGRATTWEELEEVLAKLKASV